MNNIKNKQMEEFERIKKLVTKKWFKETFDKIADEDGNGELAEKPIIKENKEEEDSFTIILFDLDCGRAGLHRNCEIKINTDRKEVRTEFHETPIEGGDIDSRIRRAVEERIGYTKEKPKKSPKDDLEILREKAAQWDKLEQEIAAIYEGPDGDLCEIGEAAATAFGYL